MVTAVAVQYVDGIDLVKIVLEGICCEYAGHAGIESGSQYSHDAGVLETLLIGPLP